MRQILISLLLTVSSRKWRLCLAAPVLLLCIGATSLHQSHRWNPGTPVWQSSWTILESGQPEYAKKSGHPYLLNRSLSYLYREKGEAYFNEFLAPYGGVMVFGSSFADKYQPHGFGDAVNHYYVDSGDHGFGCPPASFFTKELAEYECSYTDAASYADFHYDRAVEHWLGIRRVGLGIAKFEAVGVAVDRDLVTSHYALDNSREKGALYLGWAAHLVQDQTNPYHTTNDLKTTLTYHAPFEDALDVVIRNGKLRVPMDTWSPIGGFASDVASATGAMNPSTAFISGLPDAPRRPSEIVKDNAANSKSFKEYLKKTACVNDDLLHAGQACDGFFEESWGQVLEVQADRAVKSVAGMIAMFLNEVREPSIVSPKRGGPSVVEAFGGSARRVVTVDVDANPHTETLLLDAKWDGVWHERVATSSNSSLEFDVSVPSIPEGLVDLRVRACYGPDPSRDCNGLSDPVNIVVDRVPPQASMSDPESGETFSNEMRVIGFGKDDRSFGIASTRIQASFQKETSPEKPKSNRSPRLRRPTEAVSTTGAVARTDGAKAPGKSPQRTADNIGPAVATERVWRTIAESDNANVSANVDVTGWEEQLVSLRTQACDRAGNCVYSMPIDVRINHTAPDLSIVSVAIGDPVTRRGRTQWPVTVVVQNGGGGNTNGFDVQLKLGSSTSSAKEANGLPGGAARAFNFNLTADPTPCGSRISVTVDPANAVQESNESNNGMTEARIC